MIEALFMFGGRINRLQYFLASLVTHLVGGGILVLGVVSMGRGGAGAVIAILATAGLAMLWMSLSLQAARIRDIGLNPLLVLMAFAAIYTMTHIGKEMTKGTEIGTLLAGLAFVLQALFGFFLLFTPGHAARPGDPPAPGDETIRVDRRAAMIRSDEGTAARPSTRPSHQSPTRASQAAPRTSFGRRGA